MAVKLFYPLGKCEEQIIATNEESRLFIYLLLKDIKLFLQERLISSSKELIGDESYFHHVKTIPDGSGIVKRIGYRLEKNGEDTIIDVCEYRLITGHVLSKLMGRLIYGIDESIKISAIRYYSVISEGTSTLRMPKLDTVKQETYFVHK